MAKLATPLYARFPKTPLPVMRTALRFRKFGCSVEGCSVEDPFQNEEIRSARSALLSHPIYTSIKTLEELRSFMRDHVFAVWDFMTLAKRLQLVVTSLKLPWTPPADSKSARFINEIILAEESDEGPDGVPRSHLEMYLEAMDEVGACREQFDQFLAKINDGIRPQDALREVGAPVHVQEFVSNTLNTGLQGCGVEVCASFFHGREDLIPDMFNNLIPLWGGQDNAPLFSYYLRRHIEIDGDEHGPAASRLLSSFTRRDPIQEEKAVKAAAKALRARIRLWDGTLANMKKTVAAKNVENAVLPDL